MAPNGRLYSGDLNLFQSLVAALADFTQTHDVGTLRVGDSSIQLVKYGTAEARITAALRTDGILRALGGLYTGAFTTTQRDAIASGSRPYGLIILNTTTNRLEMNFGTDATPNWQPVSPLPTSGASFPTVGLYAGFRHTMIYSSRAFEFEYHPEMDAAYPWHCIGGPWLYSDIPTEQSPSATSQWSDLATSGPSIVVPGAGVYEAEGKANVANTSGAFQGVQIGIGTAAGNVAPAISDASNHQVNGRDYTGLYGEITVAAGASIRLKYYSFSTLSMTFGFRRLRIRPIKLAP